MRLLALASPLLLGACMQTTGQAELTLSISPSSFSDLTKIVRVVATATNEDGTTGSGTVAFDATAGHLSSASAVLDPYGKARADLSCDAAAGDTCSDPIKVTARWQRTSAATGGAASVVASAVAGPASGGGSAPLTTDLRTDSSWKVFGGSAPAGWTALDFDDTSWQPVTVQAPPNADLDGSAVWDGPSNQGSARINVRRGFDVPGTEVIDARVSVAFNDDGEIWVNGTRVFGESDGAVTFAREISISSVVRPGRNVVAITVSDVVPPDHTLRALLRVRSRTP